MAAVTVRRAAAGTNDMRVLLRAAGGEPTTLLALIRARNGAQGREPAIRTDLRFGEASDGRVFILNKHDGTIRMLVPPAR